MKIVYLQEETRYTTTELVQRINEQLKPDQESEDEAPVQSAFSETAEAYLDKDFFVRLKTAMDKLPREDRETAVVRQSGDSFTFKFIGLFDFIDDDTRTNLTLFFLPKFIGIENLGTGLESARNSVLLAVDRYNRELNRLGEMAEELERHESLLELAVRVLRDYLENGVYTKQQRELEHNGQGEIDWETTIDQYQPVFLKGQDGRRRPIYMDTATELANSDEDHYITRLHQCLVTTWGRKLEELGLSTVLRVNVPLLSEDDLVHFGAKEYQLDQIRKEMAVQFVTKSRHTLSLMKELIERMSESQSTNDLCLSFGMNGAEHLWEKACAEVLGSELEEPINKCGLEWTDGVTFSKYMPRPIWAQILGGSDPKEDENPCEQSGWRLDFIRTWHETEKGSVTKLVILDAKYYDFTWDDNDKIQGSLPGIGDIAKQIFYQFAFKNLIDSQSTKPAIVNAFLFPEDDVSKRLPKDENDRLAASEIVQLVWKKDRTIDRAKGFGDMLLFAVRIPGIELFRRYASGENADKWFEEIVDGEEKARTTLTNLKLSC